jgi:putative transposase
MPLWRLFYHLVWSTKQREPLIGTHQYQTLQGLIRSAGQNNKSLIHAVGIMSDHVHVVATIPPSLSIAKVVGQLKGHSSRRLNEVLQAETGAHFSWQDEYSVFSFSERALADVIDYVNNQPARHAANRLWPGLERTE